MEGTILLVDDEEKNLKMLGAMLLHEGYRVLKADSGEKAIEFLKTVEVQLVLLDIMMPGLSGFDVLKTIRENKDLVAMPVIVLSSLDGRDDRIKGLQMGADDFISKPFDMGELRAKVSTQVKLNYFRKHLDESLISVKVLNTMDDGVIVTDRDFTPISVNVKAKKLLGMRELPMNILAYIIGRYKQDIRIGEVKTNTIIKQISDKNAEAVLLSLSIEQIKGDSKAFDSYMFIIKEIE